MYPQNIDQFTEKKNHILDSTGHVIQEGDDVLAEHINDLQDGVVAIEETLGLNPQGDYASLADRLNDYKNVGILKIPTVAMYFNDPKTIDGVNTIPKALDVFASYSYVIIDSIALDSAEPKSSTAFSIINGSLNTVIGKIDMAIGNITLIKEKIYDWYDATAKGVMLDKFDYRYLTRVEQNELIEYAHSLGLFIVMSGNASNIFDQNYVEGKNNYTPIVGLSNRDVYLVDDFAYSNGAYNDLPTLHSRMTGYIEYRKQFNMQLWGLSYISTQAMFYYVNAAAMMYSLDGLFTSPSFTQHIKFEVMPLVGEFRTNDPKVLVNGSRYYRTTSFGQVYLDPNGVYKINGGKIPIDFIDSSVITFDANSIVTIDGSKIIGDLSTNVMKANVIGAINASTEQPKINEAQLGALSGDKIAQAVLDVFASQNELFINQLAVNMLHVMNDMTVDGSITADRIKTNVIQAVNASIDSATINSAKIAALESSHIQGVVIEAINASIESATIGAAKIGELNADNIKASVIEATTARLEELQASEILADKARIEDFSAQVINAANVYADSVTANKAKFNSAIIGELQADHIKAAVIEATTAKIDELLVEEATIQNGYIDNLVSKVVEAMNLHATRMTAEEATINSAMISSLTADHIQAVVIEAMEANIGTATIDSALIGELQAEHIQAAVIDAVTASIAELKASVLEADKAKINALSTNIIDSINITARDLNATYATLDEAVIGALSATHIEASVIEAVNGYFENIAATNFTAEQANIISLGANMIDALNIKAGQAALGSATIDAAVIGQLTASNIQAAVVDALEARIGELRASVAEIDKAAINELSAQMINAINLYADTVTGDKATFNSATIGSLSAGNIQAEVINAIEARINDLTVTSGTFENLLADVIKSDLINTSNVRITSAAGSAGPTDALLSIDQAGMVIQSKAVADTTTKVMKLTKDGLYISKNGGNLPDINGTTLNGTWDLKIDGERLYIDSADINNLAVKNAHIDTVAANKLIAGDISASNSIRFVAAAGATGGNAMIIDNMGMMVTDNPAAPSKWVKVDKDGISISQDGTTWSAKLDADKLYISEAEIPMISADKIYASTLDASVVTIVGGDVTLDTNGLTIYGATGKGVKIITTDNKNITLNKDGLTADNFKITSAGNVEITGKVQGTSGYFGSNTDGIQIGSTGLTVVGTGTIRNANTEITNNNIIVYKAEPTVALLIGEYALGKYGLSAGDGSTILDETGLTLKGGNSSIRLGLVDIPTDNYNFKVLANGNLYAQNADIVGKVTATSGSFGGTTNKVNVSSTGIDIGNGEIYSSDRKLILNSTGITAKAGYIGTVTIDDTGLHAPNLLDFLSNGIKVKGNKAISIDAGTLVVTDNTLDYVTLGKLDATNYGLRVDIPSTTTKVYLNQAGFRIEKNPTTPTFVADTSGDITVTGTINATAGSFSNVSISGALTVAASGSITAGDTTINNNGLTINGTQSSINLGSGNFIVTSSGNITAKAGTIGGVTVGATSLTTGQITINNAGKISVGTALDIGLYDGTNYGIKVNGTNPIILNSNGLSSTNFSINSTTGNVNVTGNINATSGNFGGVNINGDLTITDGSIIAGGTVLNRNGISITQGSIALGTGFSVTNSGVITATAGTIGGVTINNSSLDAGSVELKSTGVYVKNSSNADVLHLGEYEAAKYGLLVNAGDTKITLSGSGLKASYTNPSTFVVTDLFNISSSGDLSVTGAINATSGTFSGTVNATAGNFANGKVSITASGLNVESSGMIQAGNTKLYSTGIEIGAGGSINLSDKFIANDNGIQAVAGHIGGWKLEPSVIYSGESLAGAAIKLDSANSQIVVGSNVLIGKYTMDTVDYYGIKVLGNMTIDSRGFIARNTLAEEQFKIDTDGNVTMKGTIHSTAGDIGGWEIESSKIIKKDGLGNSVIELDSNNEVINVKTAVKIGKLSTGVYGLKLGNNITFDETNGLQSTNFSISASGNAYFKGQVEADQGYFGTNVNGIQIGATGLTVVGYGIIEAGNTQISSSGIQIGSDSTINLNSNFIASNDGIQAIAGHIANWKLTSNSIYSGIDLATSKMKLNSSTETISIGTDDVVLGKYDGIHYGLKLGDNISFNSTYGFVVTDDALNPKLTIDTTGAITMEGTITAGSGTIGGWKIESGRLVKLAEDSSNIIGLDSTNAVITIKDDIKLGQYESGKYGLKLGSILTLNTTEGLTSNNFTIDTAGNASFNGKVTSTEGHFGTATNGVVIGSTGLEIKGTGLIKNSNMEISSDKITVKNGATSVVTLGLYNTGKYGLATADESVTLDTNGLTLKGGTSSIRMGEIDATLDKYKFKVTADGLLYAQNATIEGLISSASGSFGDTTNHIDITATGLSLGTGEIYTLDRELVLNASGITARKGTIGGITIGTTKLTAGSVIINSSGTIEVGSNVVVGLFDTNKYGVKVSTTGGKTIVLDSNGLVANNGTEDTFKIAADGSVILKGSVTATSGSFSGSVYATSGRFGGVTDNVTIGSTGLTVQGNGEISIADGTVRMNNSGLTMSKGSITLGSNFSVNTSGHVVASSAAFGGVTLNSKGFIAGNTEMTSQGINVFGVGAVTVNEGSMHVKNEAGFEVLRVGKDTINSTSYYGMTIYGANTVKNTYGARTSVLDGTEQTFTYTSQADRAKVKRIKLTMSISAIA